MTLQELTMNFVTRYDARGLARTVDGINKVKRAADGLDDTLRRIGTVSLGLFSAATNEFRNYEFALTEYAGKAMNSVDEFERKFGKASARIARHTGLARREVLRSLQEGTSALLSAEEAIDMTKKVAYLASGNQALTRQAAGVALSGYRNRYGSPGKILDYIYAAAQLGQGQVAEFSPAAQSIFGFSRGAGIELPEVAAGLAVISSTAPSPIMGATQMGAFLTGIARGSTHEKLLKSKSGASSQDMRNMLRNEGLAKTVEFLANAFSGDELQQVYGRKELVQFVQGTTGRKGIVTRIQNEIEDNVRRGPIEEFHKDIRRTLQYEFRSLFEALGELGSEFGKPLATVLKPVLSFLNGIVMLLTNINYFTKGIFSYIILLASGMAVLRAVFGGIIGRTIVGLFRMGRHHGQNFLNRWGVATPGPGKPQGGWFGGAAGVAAEVGVLGAGGVVANKVSDVLSGNRRGRRGRGGRAQQTQEVVDDKPEVDEQGRTILNSGRRVRNPYVERNWGRFGTPTFEKKHVKPEYRKHFFKDRRYDHFIDDYLYKEFRDKGLTAQDITEDMLLKRHRKAFREKRLLTWHDKRFIYPKYHEEFRKGAFLPWRQKKPAPEQPHPGPTEPPMNMQFGNQLLDIGLMGAMGWLFSKAFSGPVATSKRMAKGFGKIMNKSATGFSIRHGFVGGATGGTMAGMLGKVDRYNDRLIENNHEKRVGKWTAASAFFLGKMWRLLSATATLKGGAAALALYAGYKAIDSSDWGKEQNRIAAARLSSDFRSEKIWEHNHKLIQKELELLRGIKLEYDATFNAFKEPPKGVLKRFWFYLNNPGEYFGQRKRVTKSTQMYLDYARILKDIDQTKLTDEQRHTIKRAKDMFGLGTSQFLNWETMKSTAREYTGRQQLLTGYVDRDVLDKMGLKQMPHLWVDTLPKALMRYLYDSEGNLNEVTASMERSFVDPAGILHEGEAISLLKEEINQRRMFPERDGTPPIRHTKVDLNMYVTLTDDVEKNKQLISDGMEEMVEDVLERLTQNDADRLVRMSESPLY